MELWQVSTVINYHLWEEMHRDFVLITTLLGNYMEVPLCFSLCFRIWLDPINLSYLAPCWGFMYLHFTWRWRFVVLPKLPIQTQHRISIVLLGPNLVAFSFCCFSFVNANVIVWAFMLILGSYIHCVDISYFKSSAEIRNWPNIGSVLFSWLDFGRVLALPVLFTVMLCASCIGYELRIWAGYESFLEHNISV